MRLAGRDRGRAGCVAALLLLAAGLVAAQIGWLGSPELERLRRGAAELGVAWAAARHPDGFRPPRLALTLDDAARAKLADHVARAHAIGFIPHSDEDWMRGRLWRAGRDFDVRVRLKGDFLDHVRYGASLRVKLRGDARVLGLRTFNLQHPKTRRFLWEWAFMRHAAAEGLLVPRHEFVELVRDGGAPEPMLLIEHFSKELLERQARREGVILKFSEQDLYAAGIRKRELFGPDVNLLTGSREAPLQVFGASRVAESPDLAYQRDRAFERFDEFRHGRRAAREVFDPERLGRWLAVSALWGAYHGFHWNNTRAYFDPARGRFEPVAYDGFAGPVSEEQYGEYLLHNSDYAERHLFSDPLVSRAYARELRRLTDPAAVQELLEDLVPHLQARVGFLSALPEFRDGIGRWTHFGWLSGNARALRERLDRPAEALAFWNPASAGGVLELSADSPLALVWETLELADGRVLRVPAEPRSLPFELLPGRRHDVPVAAQAYRLPPGLAPPRAVVVRVAGDPEAAPARIAVVSRREAAPAEPLGLTVSSGRLVRADPPPPPTLPDGFRVAERDGQHWVTASPGEHALLEDLRVPPGFGLALLPGTHLRMGTGVVIVVEGPVEIVGTATRPVEMSAQGEAWEGLVVLGADRRSRIEHARFRGVAPRPGSVGPRRDGWMQTGGVVFVDAPVSVAHVHFEDFATEDALNVVRADVDLRDVAFRRVVSDAFDGDFVRGEIEGAKLEDIGGDGIDLSGSEVVIRDVRARAVRDKAISVGELSRVSVAGLDSEDGAFALVAKDGSVVDVRDVRTRDIWVALAAFTKKNEFGPAVLTASGLVVSGRSFPSLVQTGSRLTLDGRRVATRSFDSGDLYAPR